MSQITHDLNNAYAILNLQLSNLERLLPLLIEGYRLAQNRNLIEKPVSENQLNLFRTITQDMRTELKKFQSLALSLQEK